jgi:hypothetical protein
LNFPRAQETHLLEQYGWSPAAGIYLIDCRGCFFLHIFCIQTPGQLLSFEDGWFAATDGPYLWAQPKWVANAQ